MQQSKLENILSSSFPANHLLQFSIVKQEAEQAYKKAYFFFITMAPGVQNQQGGRTFDFNNRITMKVESYQIGEFAHALRTYARGQENLLGPFSIYVDSGKSAYSPSSGSGKSLILQKTQVQKPKQNQNASQVTLFFKVGNNAAIGYSMTPYRALVIADKLEALSEYCDKLEFARGSVQIGAYENPEIGHNEFPLHPPNNVEQNFTNAFENDNVPF